VSLKELIATLEAATGPNREWDLAICRTALDSKPLGHAAGMTDEMLLSHGYFGPMPHYTASIDAALTLVSDDARWTISVPRQPDMSGKRYWASLRSNHPGARGSTPAIALCIAALRARAAA
jgi:hypothetical protein